jgi:hypothetical protein
VTSVSRSLEDLLTWRLVLLGTGVGVLPGDSMVRLLPQLQVIIDACYKVSEWVVGRGWCNLLTQFIPCHGRCSLLVMLE